MALEGFKYWADGEPVVGIDANAFLMSQSVMRFDDASDRDSALARTLASGMLAYNKSTTTLQLYDGSSWVDVATGTLTADHGALTGLADDDHTQYHNDARGDVRYYTQSQVDSSLSGKSDTSHTHSYAAVSHTHSYADASHTHSYLSTSGGTISGDLTVTGVIDVNEVRGDDGSASDPSFTFTSDQDLGIYRQASNSLGITTGNVQHYWNSNGIYLASGDWFRTTGNSGWYSQSYGGGIYMIDTTWVRTYQNKRIYTGSGQIRSDAGNAFNAPNMTATWSYNTVRWNSSNGDLMRYASLTEMKDDIVDINGVLGYLNERSLIYDLKPKIFREADNRVDAEGNPVYTTRGEYGHGMLAEDVLEVAPELAYFDHNGELTSYGNDALIPDIIAELQRLMPMVEELYSAAHPDWVAPTPRPADRAADERQRYDEAAAAQAAVGFDDISDPLDGQRHLEED